MLRKSLCVGLAVGLALSSGLSAQPAATDPEVLKGIAQVEEGEYDGAIFTLDTAARRLAGDPERVGDLSQAYLYLGIAYFGKGHEAAAKAKFREAIQQFRGLSLSVEQYPPKIIDLFEAAREEADSDTAATAPGEAADTAVAAAPGEQKKGGSKMPLILIGVGGAAAAGVALAVGGGGGGDGSTPPEPQIRTENFSGTLDIEEYCRGFRILVAANGMLEADLNWTDPFVALLMGLYDNPDYEGEWVAVSNRVTDTSARLSHPVNPRTYVLEVCQDSSPCHERYDEGSGDSCPATFELIVRHP